MDPLAPRYILRGHTAQLSVLAFAADRASLYSGDVDGWVGVWDLATFRPRLFWRAHEAGLLTLVESAGCLLTHARDNQVHAWALLPAASSISRAAASAVPSVKNPSTLAALWSMDVNAMAYCQMSVYPLPSDPSGALLAVPSLTQDELIDIFHIPTQQRVHRSIGANLFPIGDKTGTLMAVSIFDLPSASSSSSILHLLAAYEDGRVVMFRFTGSTAQALEPPTTARQEGQWWELLWEHKGHREAVMAIAVAPDKKSAWSVAADHYLCKYRLFDSETDRETPRMQQLETTSPGRAAVAIRDDGKLIGVAGWDGEVRLYSAKSGRPLAVLSYHRASLHAIAFARLPSSDPAAADDSDDDEADQRPRAWLAAGGKEDTISLWEVYPPDEN